MFTQNEKTKYTNNEFADMPSIDYHSSSYRLYKNNMNCIDWDKVNEICTKHGFRCVIVKRTFSDEYIDVFILHKTDITNTHYQELRKAKDYKELNALETQRKDLFLKLHDCLHELDLETNLYFDCGWVGNCGLFGSNDVKRICYSHASNLVTSTEIFNIWSPLIYDTRSKISSNAVYVMCHTAHAKFNPTYVFDEFTDDLALSTAKEIQPNLNIEFEVGKRGCDDASYKALVVRDKKGNYIGSMRFNKDMHGIVYVTTMVPLAGQRSFKTKRNDFRKDMEGELHFMTA